MGVSAFVAHEDIEPSLEWQKEIESALQTADVLCALITPEFHASRWTDQEVGFALGRNTPIVAVRLGADPYGFIGKIQAVSGSLDRPVELATSIIDAGMKFELIRGKLIDGLVGAVAEAPSYLDARAGIQRVLQHKQLLSRDQVERLLRAARDNSQVSQAFGVADKIKRLAKEAGVTLPDGSPQTMEDNEIPF
jgi:hypothetical protein